VADCNELTLGLAHSPNPPSLPFKINKEDFAKESPCQGAYAIPKRSGKIVNKHAIQQRALSLQLAEASLRAVRQ